MSNEKGRKIGRDAGNGRFIPVEEAKKKPKNAIVEVIKPQEKKKK